MARDKQTLGGHDDFGTLILFGVGWSMKLIYAWDGVDFIPQ